MGWKIEENKWRRVVRMTEPEGRDASGAGGREKLMTTCYNRKHVGKA